MEMEMVEKEKKIPIVLRPLFSTRDMPETE